MFPLVVLAGLGFLALSGWLTQRRNRARAALRRIGRLGHWCGSCDGYDVCPYCFPKDSEGEWRDPHPTISMMIYRAFKACKGKYLFF